MTDRIPQLFVLGPFRLLGPDGQSIEIRAKKARALLAHLALHPHGAETREKLAALLWGEMGDERARANLRQTLSTLRTALGDPDGRVLVSDDDTVRLVSAALDVDALRVSRLASGSARDDWEAAAALYGGELLADVAVAEEPFDAWLAAERRNLTQAACKLFGRLAAARRADGDLPGAEDVLQRWLALEPTCEEAHRGLMEVFAATGRRSKALEQFALCRDALDKSFGVGPEPATLALHRSVCAEPASADLPAGAQLPPLPLPTKPSVAVMPFENQASEGEEWLGDGIAEDVIVALSKFSTLLVIARQSSFALRDRVRDTRAIGRALGVHYLLTGSVRRGGGRLKVAVQLADAGTGATVWAESYEGTSGDLFDVVDRITRVIVSTLAGRVAADRTAQARRKPTASLEAYDCLLKAKHHHHLYSADDNAIALECLQRATALDPDFALAHAWMACVIVQSAAFTPDPTVLDRGYQHVLRAVALEEGESECHRVLAAYYLIRRRFDEAEHHQSRALALNPNDDRIVCQQGELLTFFGRPDEGIGWIEQAMRLNPYHPAVFFSDYARALYDADRSAEALGALRRIRAPRFSHHAQMAACAARLGDRAGAGKHLAEARRLRPGFDGPAFARSLPYRASAAAERLAADLAAAEKADER